MLDVMTQSYSLLCGGTVEMHKELYLGQMRTALHVCVHPNLAYM